MASFDTHMMVQVLTAALLGGLIGLDRTALGQFMVSQPVVAGPLTGWVLGDPLSGLVIGGTLELVWVLDMPVGTFVPADSTIAAVSATAIAVLGGTGTMQLPVAGFSLLLTAGMVPVTMFADHLMRQRNAKLPEFAAATEGVTEGRVAVAHLAGLIAFFLKSFFLCLVLVPAGLVALTWLLKLPVVVHRAMTLFVTLLPLLGVAAVARKLSMRMLDRYLFVGCGIGAAGVLLFNVPVPVTVLLAAVAGWLGVRAHGA
jgi:mannose/fructose/N-acetylgalactosamine-specific phosphotransferase system component IIC